MLSVSPSVRASASLLPIKPSAVRLPTESVSAINGVIKRTLFAKELGGPVPAGSTSGVIAAFPGSVTSPLTATMGFDGYSHKGAVAAVADINPGDGDMSTVTVKARLLKGFTYSVGSSLNWQQTKKSTPSLAVRGPSETKALLVAMRGGSFIAKETGDYTFTFSLNNGARFNGSFSMSLSGREPSLPSTTGNKNVDAVLARQTAWWHDKGTNPERGSVEVMPGVKALSSGSSRQLLTYSFIAANAAPTEVLKNDFPANGQAKQFSEMDANQKASVRAALDYVSAVTNLRFSEATDGTGNIQLGRYNMDASAGGKEGLAGISNLPGSYPATDKVYTFVSGGTNGGLGDSTAGSFGWAAIWHELGHALGLKHPGNYDAAGGKGEGPFLPGTMDNRQYSIMSYKSNQASAGINNQSYMLLDVAALQFLYGVNPLGSTAQGDTVGAGGKFTFSDSSTTLKTLYSATGKDTIDLSGLSKSSWVNLNPGTYSSINSAAPPGPYSGNNTVAIAYGSRINKVRLGTGPTSDTVVLNSSFQQGAFNQISNLQTEDRIGLSRALFGKMLSSKNLQIGTSSTAASLVSRIIVNQNTREIFYDADGSASRMTAVKIATYETVQGATVSAESFAFLA